MFGSSSLKIFSHKVEVGEEKGGGGRKGGGGVTGTTP